MAGGESSPGKEVVGGKVVWATGYIANVDHENRGLRGLLNAWWGWVGQLHIDAMHQVEQWGIIGDGSQSLL